jgi:hypothetical protein
VRERLKEGDYAMKPLNSDSLTDDEFGAWFAKLSAARRRELIRQTIEDLEHQGLIRDSGLRRNGKIVYELANLRS